MLAAARHPIATIVLALGLAALIPGTGRADTVVLRTGEVLSGRVLRASTEEVSIQLESGGILSFRGNRVEKVRRQNPTGEGVIDRINVFEDYMVVKHENGEEVKVYGRDLKKKERKQTSFFQKWREALNIDKTE